MKANIAEAMVYVIRVRNNHSVMSPLHVQEINPFATPEEVQFYNDQQSKTKAEI